MVISKKGTEEDSNLLSNKKIIKATKPQSTSKHLSTRHQNTCVWNEYLSKLLGVERSRKVNNKSNGAKPQLKAN